MHIGELNVKAKKKRKRVGRGPGSGHGKTSARGQKGQHSRSGSGHRPWFEGGQMPLQRRVPKRGFFSRNKKVFQLVNVDALQCFEEGQTVDPEALVENGLIKRANLPIKILGNGSVDRKLTVHADAFSGSAKEKITGAGGEIIVRERNKGVEASA